MDPTACCLFLPRKGVCKHCWALTFGCTNLIRILHICIGFSRLFNSMFGLVKAAVHVSMQWHKRYVDLANFCSFVEDSNKLSVSLLPFLPDINIGAINKSCLFPVLLVGYSLSHIYVEGLCNMDALLHRVSFYRQRSSEPRRCVCLLPCSFIILHILLCFSRLTRTFLAGAPCSGANNGVVYMKCGGRRRRSRDCSRGCSRRGGRSPRGES